MTVNEIICSNIAELRKKQGLSQEELAGMLGVTFQAVSKWENHLSCPDITLIPELAEIFQISIDDLFGRTHGKKVDEKLVSWPDDDTLHAVLFQGQRLLKSKEISADLPKIELKYIGNMQNVDIRSEFGITVAGDIVNSRLQSGTQISCFDIVDSSVHTGCHLNAVSINGCDTIHTGAHINAANISCNNLETGAGIHAVNVSKKE